GHRDGQPHDPGQQLHDRVRDVLGLQERPHRHPVRLRRDEGGEARADHGEADGVDRAGRVVLADRHRPPQQGAVIAAGGTDLLAVVAGGRPLSTQTARRLLLPCLLLSCFLFPDLPAGQRGGDCGLGGGGASGRGGGASGRCGGCSRRGRRRRLAVVVTAALPGVAQQGGNDRGLRDRGGIEGDEEGEVKGRQRQGGDE